MRQFCFLISFLVGFSALAQSDETHWYYNADEQGVAIGGYDTVAYFEGDQAVKGDPKYVFAIEGVSYHFSSKANLDKFKAEPEKYMPQFGGWCAFAAGVDAEKYGFGALRFGCDPTSFKVSDGKLYLFAKLAQFDALGLWNKEDEAEMVKRGQAFWKGRMALAKTIGTLPKGMNAQAPMETAQFDFFIGEWDSTTKWMNNLKTKSYGPVIKGHWTAYYHWNGFAIADDWRQVGVPGSGGPAFRSFDPKSKKWVMTYIPANQPREQTWMMEGVFDEKGELEGELEGVDFRGTPYMQKVYFYDIKPDSFRWRSDRSYDKGKTWIKDFGITECVRRK